MPSNLVPYGDIQVTAFRYLELTGQLLPEPLLTERGPNSRLFLHPIHDDEIYGLYEEARDLFWIPHEIDMKDDAHHWATYLTDDERSFFEKILAFFAGSDAIVNENIVMNFAREIKSQESRLFYYIQLAIESIHTDTYGRLLNILIPDNERKLSLFQAINELPTVAKKAEWALRWMNAERSSFAERLVAYAIVEGLFFSGSFCAIYWINTRKLLPGVCKSNEFIAKDEGSHCDFACFLYANRIVNKLPEETIHEILQEAVDIETEFICDALPNNLQGMNKTLMTEYIQMCANRIAVSLGVSPLFPGATNPFPFMNKISLRGKTNFFEQRNADYAKASVQEIITDYENEDF